VAFDDFTAELSQPPFEPDPDGGWAELMDLAKTFPLERLSFGGAREPGLSVEALTLPGPRAVCYDDVIDIVDATGDGPLIGLGAGLSLAVW
jgi:hypothetical protein